MSSGIYCIRNVTNGRSYVGSAVNIPRRWSGHKHDLSCGKHHSRVLQNSWNKYGEECFVFEIIETVQDVTQLIAREQHWIDFLRSADRFYGFNIQPSASSPLGVKRSAETRAKLAEAKKNISVETRDKMAAAKVGRKRSEQSRLKQSLATKGRPISAARAERHSAILVARNKSETQRKIVSATMAETNRALAGKPRAPYSEERLAKLKSVGAQKGQGRTLESRLKQSATIKAKNTKNGFVIRA